MTPLLRTSACLLLAAAYALAAVAPCAPVLRDSAAGLPFAASAERIAAWEATGEAEPPTSIAAECPCGCEKKSPVRAGTAGFALPRPMAEPAIAGAGIEIAFAPPVARIAPDRLPEPIPI